MKTTSEQLKMLRENHGLSQQDVSGGTGINQSLVSRHETGVRVPGRKMLQRYAAFYHVSVDDLLERPREVGEMPEPAFRLAHQGRDAYPSGGPEIYLPIFGEIRAGSPCFAEQIPIGKAKVETEKVQHDVANFFWLRVKGDSMVNAGIVNGGLVLVHSQQMVNENDIAVVMVDQTEATVKRVKFRDGDIILHPANSAYEPVRLPRQEVEILGRVVQAKVDF